MKTLRHIMALFGIFFCSSTLMAHEAGRPSSQLYQIRLPFIEMPHAGSETVYQAQTLSGVVQITPEGHLVYTLPSHSASHYPFQLTEQFTDTAAIIIKAEDPLGIPLQFITGSSLQSQGTGQSIQGYNRLSMGEIYPGISLQLNVTGKNVEKIFIVQPHADTSLISGKFSEDVALSTSPLGELVIRRENDQLSFTKPVAFQEIDGVKKFVEIAYRVSASSYSFAIGTYDVSRELIIDPLLASTYIDETSEQEGVVIDASPNGDIYVCATAMAGFPTTTAGYAPVFKGGTSDIAILKMDANLTSLQAATFVGGSGDDIVMAMRFIGDAILVAGTTTSLDFPIKNGYDNDSNGDMDIFVAKLSLDLSTLIASTFLGGSSEEGPKALALDGDGNIYLTGLTASTDFPMAQPALTENPPDGFIAKFTSDLTALLAVALYGGNGFDEPRDIIVDESHVYIAGWSESDNLPATGTGYLGGPNDGFIALFDTSLQLQQAIYLGGTDMDGLNVLLKANNSIYAAGITNSTDLPATGGSFQPAYQNSLYSGHMDGFISRLSLDLATISRTTYFGGSSEELIAAIGNDSQGRIIIGGETSSADLFPTQPTAYQPDLTVASEGFLAILNADLDGLQTSSYFGGNGTSDAILSIWPFNDFIYFAGITNSTNLPVRQNAYSTSLQGASANVFVAKLDSELSMDLFPLIAVSPAQYNFGELNLNLTKVKSFSISNTGNSPLVITETSITNDSSAQFAIAANTCGNTLSAGQSCLLSISYTPKTAGTVNVGLRILSNADNSPAVTLPITGTGTIVESYMLTIYKSGIRNGYVYSEDGSITCGSTCTATIVPNAAIVLHATFNADTTIFGGWTGATCDGTGLCQLTMTRDITIQATFRNLFPGAVSKTDQTSCFDSSGMMVDCQSTRQDGFMQAGIVNPRPRFNDNGDGTVTDALTGLTWLKDGNCLGNTVQGEGWNDSFRLIEDFNLHPDNYDCADYSADYDAWLLPNLNELASLLLAPDNARKSLETAGFITEAVHPFAGYWSSTTTHTATSNDSGWVISVDGGVIQSEDKTRKRFIWPVRN